MKFLRAALPWLFLVSLCASCGKSGDTIQTADSMAEAKTLAAQEDCYIVVEFWRHG